MESKVATQNNITNEEIEAKKSIFASKIAAVAEKDKASRIQSPSKRLLLSIEDDLIEARNKGVGYTVMAQTIKEVYDFVMHPATIRLHLKNKQPSLFENDDKSEKEAPENEKAIEEAETTLPTEKKRGRQAKVTEG